MKLWALGDVHVGYAKNRAALESLRPRPDDWLILCGDVGERLTELAWTISTLHGKFARLLWVPGNHELWTMPGEGLRGVAKYEACVAVCRAAGVLTPEDAWPLWPGEGPKRRVALCHLLYDYSFSPDGFTPDQARAWAREEGIVCRDEDVLHADPYPSREAWCAARIEATEARLRALPRDERIILVNHFPLRADLIRLFRIPRFSPWCGTRKTEGWHTRFPIEVAVHGHLHMRCTDWRDGVRFEETALGYPRHWDEAKGIEGYLREILPGTRPVPEGGSGGPVWWR